ncbi:sodium-extruding oxaloacetate decarboxylase subunit alpha [Methylophaga nitratireducenticrescens]|uniref:Oxaloacetate decarboxylase alpha chain n=1 Tax=Methylophaga nitratireducenticrescens TaxID=754476 RepID=I1XKM6_METNJ|nr:sodium-extruding oxaloacetate decarboxylase subunit alpha [Methylophaga nitratireducenticrescens]AFI84945.1 oxaloacetate decarboxylase subunit alpha [Methylophaga nitratireducenticrescens]AUZ84958.1 oxaloacetate decarboxylase subunit alpha [Methylophaga nitratireducenticrescens]
MTEANKKLGITDVVLRDAHQSLFATRLRLDDMLPIADKLDQVGYWSVETWGGATFDACIRYLGEDPWHRIRSLKAAMPNTPQQMLLRGQNLLGYRHYADDVVRKFVERASINGVDVFRVFDAMNDPRNLEVAIKAVLDNEKHAQGTMAYTISPVHDLQMWLDMAKRIEDMGAHSLCIKDMAGLLKPYKAYELVKSLKQTIDIPIHMQSHATTGLSTATIMKCVEAGIDNVDTAISSMSMTYGHSATESVVAIFEDTDSDTGLNIELLEEIAAYFRDVRKKYAKFEGSLRGVDSRILVAQVPGGMLTNMESQLREQNALDRMDEVLHEIPRVREDLGFIPLVTPTSQIVGTQAVINVLTGERYKSITEETQGVLRGEYGSAPAAFNAELQKRVLNDEQAITCRPADLLEDEMEKLTSELISLAETEDFKLEEGERQIDDVLTFALFNQTAIKFLKNRGNPDAFEPLPTAESTHESSIPAKSAGSPETYTITVNGQQYVVEVNEGGDISQIDKSQAPQPSQPAASEGVAVKAPLSGNIWKIMVSQGQSVKEGDVLLILEAMKMETQIVAEHDGTVTSINVKPGDTVKVGDSLVSIA